MDQSIGIEDESKMVEIARKVLLCLLSLVYIQMFWGGFLFLPWLWLVNWLFLRQYTQQKNGRELSLELQWYVAFLVSIKSAGTRRGPFASSSRSPRSSGSGTCFMCSVA